METKWHGSISVWHVLDILGYIIGYRQYLTTPWQQTKSNEELTPMMVALIVVLSLIGQLHRIL